MSAPGLLVAALGLDAILGDPNVSWHPVRLMGRAIRILEQRLRFRPGNLRLRGVGLLLLVCGGSYLLGLIYLRLAQDLSLGLGLGYWAYFTAEALLLWSCLGVRSMADHLGPVLLALKMGQLDVARAAVAKMVGRDTAQLDEAGVLRAGVETVAEGLCDGVIAPLCFAALGGVPLALAYRALNTLDSMVGYKNEAYLELGWASARLDDLANWIPARLSALLIALVSGLLGLDAGAAWRTAWTDGPRQPSPNSGWPEGAFAGAMGVQLGGPVSYQGQVSDKPFLGKPLRPLVPSDGALALRLFLAATLACVALLELVALLR